MRLSVEAVREIGVGVSHKDCRRAIQDQIVQIMTRAWRRVALQQLPLRVKVVQLRAVGRIRI